MTPSTITVGERRALRHVEHVGLEDRADGPVRHRERPQPGPAGWAKLARTVASSPGDAAGDVSDDAGVRGPADVGSRPHEGPDRESMPPAAYRWSRGAGIEEET